VDSLYAGVAFFAVGVGIIGVLMARAIIDTANEGQQGKSLVGRLAPYLVAEAIFTLLFILWYLNT
jgi:hypothetical protein